jgi:hypothetical protein
MAEVMKRKGYEGARAEAEQELTYIDSETARMTKELAEMDIRRRTVVRILNAAKEALGEIAPEAAPHMADQVSENNESEDLSVVARNAFRGLGPSQAALKYLRMLDHGVPHATLVRALQKGNVKSGSSRPSDAFRNALARHPEVFVWRKEKGRAGVWELKERQKPAVPEGAVAASAVSSADAARSLSLVS